MEQRAIWANRYAIFDEIASGGMATVYIGARLGRVNGRRVVAVKKLFEQYARETDFASMFFDEARRAAEVHHPNVVRTYQVLRVPDTLAIVMELVVGASLADLLRASREAKAEVPLPIAGAVMVGALHGLHAAHEATDEMRRPFGLVHRDVSPQNILVGKDGVARVIDFGVARAAGRLHTATGGMNGKYAYMSPEQIRQDEVGVATDIYAAGLVLWELLVGWKLYDGPSEVELLAKRAAGNFPVIPPSCASPRVPSTVDDIVMRALEAEPAARFASAEEMAGAITETLGVASPEEVAAWVLRLAEARIGLLDAKLREVEDAFDSGALEEVPHAPRDSEPAPRAPRDDPRPHLAPAAGPVGVVHALAAPDLRRLGAVDDPVPRPFGARVERAEPKPPPSYVSPPSPAAAAPPAFPPPPSSPRLATASEPGPSPKYASRTLVLGIAALAIVALAALKAFPGLLRSLATRGAARRGVALSFDHAAAAWGEIALYDATFRLGTSGDLVLHAPVAHVALDSRGNPTRLLLPVYALAAHGAAADVASQFSAWTRRPGAPLDVTGMAGHLEWSDGVAPGVPLLADGVAAQLALGGDAPRLHMETSDLTAVVGGTTLGPWAAELEAVPERTRLVIALDRTRPDAPPSITLTDSAALGALVSVTIPRRKFRVLGVPPALLGLAGDPDIDLTLAAQAPPGCDTVTADARLELFGVTLPALADEDGSEPAPVDVAFAGGVNGGAAGPLEVTNGTLAVHGLVSTVTGSVRLGRAGIALSIGLTLSGHKTQTRLALDTRTWTQRAGRPD